MENVEHIYPIFARKILSFVFIVLDFELPFLFNFEVHSISGVGLTLRFVFVNVGRIFLRIQMSVTIAKAVEAV